MATVLEEYEALGPAFAKRSLQLLQSPHARAYLAIFHALFVDASESISAEDVHAAVDRHLQALWSAGYRDIPSEAAPDEAPGDIRPAPAAAPAPQRPKSGRDVCRHLIHHYRWLEPIARPDGSVAYRLTSEAAETMELVDRLGATSSVLGASRMHTLMDEIARVSVLFSPDYETGHEILRAQLEQAKRRLEQYELRGEPQQLSEEQAQDAINNILELMSHLPVDLRRLEEDVHAQGIGLMELFREDQRPLGTLIAEYVERGNHLIDDTEYGRSYLDTLRVMGDQRASMDLDDKLESIASSAVLAASRWEQSRKLRDAWSRIRTGISLVNDEQLRSSRVINRTVSSRDALRNRELSRALRELEAEAYRWAATVAPTAESPFHAAVGDWSAPSLRTRLQAPQAPLPPAKLQVEPAPPALTMEELQRLGGPQRARILDAIARELPADTRICNLAQVFNRLPAKLRRPVEVAGLVQLASDLGMDPADLAREPYECVDLDGNPSVWVGPALLVTPGELTRAREVARHD